MTHNCENHKKQQIFSTGSISSNDSGHSEAMSYCDGNLYHLTSSILHNPPLPPPIQPRRHSSIQGNTGTYNTLSSSGAANVAQPNAKQANGDINMIPPPPPPNPRTIPPHSRAPPFPMPLAVPVLPNNAGGANVAGYNIYTPQQYNQMRHAGK